MGGQKRSFLGRRNNTCKSWGRQEGGVLQELKSGPWGCHVEAWDEFEDLDNSHAEPWDHVHEIGLCSEWNGVPRSGIVEEKMDKGSILDKLVCNGLKQHWMKRCCLRTCCHSLDMSLSFWGSGLAKSIWASLARTVFQIMEMDETTQEESLRKEVQCLNPRNSNIERVQKRVVSKGDWERINKGINHSLKISMLLVEICKQFSSFYTHTYIFILPSSSSSPHPRNLLVENV